MQTLGIRLWPKPMQGRHTHKFDFDGMNAHNFFFPVETTINDVQECDVHRMYFDWIGFAPIFIWRQSSMQWNLPFHAEFPFAECRQRKRMNDTILIVIQRNNRKYSSIIYLLFQFDVRLCVGCALVAGVRLVFMFIFLWRFSRNTKFESIFSHGRKDGKIFHRMHTA